MTSERILIREGVAVWQTVANETVLVDWTLFRSYYMHAKVGPILRKHEVYAERRVLKFSHRYNSNQFNAIKSKY